MARSTQINNFKKTNTLGQSLVELLLAVGVATAIFPAVITGFVCGREGKVSED